jgi:cystathionine beta-lyase family protein involved in aluminum resistance
MEKQIALARKAMEEYTPIAEKIAEANFNRVLDSFRENKVSTQHFCSSSGYGYNDNGRDTLEEVYARVFGTEAALVRQQIVSGSHAISLAMSGNLLAGDEILLLGMPYDTLQTVIGINNPTPGSLSEAKIAYRVFDFDFDKPNLDELCLALATNTKMLVIQRSCGYSLRKSLSISVIEQIILAIKNVRPDIIILVDNCYGEMVEENEPSHVGADIVAGSLIKNLGAGIAPGGGYIVGKKNYIDRASFRLTIPGAGKELGASLIDNRLFYQALYLAPQIVMEAILGAVFAANLLDNLGFRVNPAPKQTRADIIQTIAMDNSEKLIAFVQLIQKYSPIDSYVRPQAGSMPGYDNDIIMASGSFVSGSSIELSADAPLREPYLVFLQGGLSRYHMIYALSRTIKEMQEKGLI